VTTTTLLRLADAPLLPFEFGEFAKTVERYVEEIKKLGGAKVNLQPVVAQLEKSEADSKAFEAAVGKAHGEQLAAANRAIFQSERGLILPKGLPNRDWYRHQIYAPGLYTGYGVKTLPGIREAVEGSRWDEANREVQAVAQALQQLNQHIEEATRLLGQ